MWTSPDEERQGLHSQYAEGYLFPLEDRTNLELNTHYQQYIFTRRR